MTHEGIHHTPKDGQQNTVPIAVTHALGSIGLTIDTSRIVTSSAGKLHACPEVYRHRGRKKIEPIATNIARDADGNPYFVKYTRDLSEGPRSMFYHEVTMYRALEDAIARSGNTTLNHSHLLHTNIGFSSDTPSVAVYEYLGDVTGFLQIPYMPASIGVSAAVAGRPIAQQAIALAEVGREIDPTSIDPRFVVAMNQEYYQRKLAEFQAGGIHLVRDGDKISQRLDEVVDMDQVAATINRAVSRVLASSPAETFTLSHNDLSPQNIYMGQNRTTIIDYERARLAYPYHLAATNSITELIPRVWQDQYLQMALISEFLAARGDQTTRIAFGVNLLTQTLSKMTLPFYHYAQDLEGNIYDPKVEIFLRQRLENHLQLLQIGMELAQI